MAFRQITGSNVYYAETADKPLTTTGIADGSIVLFTDTGLEESFDAQNSVWFARAQIRLDSAGNSAVNVAGLIVSSSTGAFISQTNLTLSASSQALPTPGAARVALIQTHGGTVTDRIYISLDATDATAADFFMKNVEDTTANIGGPTEMYIVGDLTDVRVLGTANASVMSISYFA